MKNLLSRVFDKVSKIMLNQDSANDQRNLLPPPQLWSRIFIWTLSIGTLTLIGWSIIVKVEDTIILTGEITTNKPEIKIVAKDGGIINKVYSTQFGSISKGEVILQYYDKQVDIQLLNLKEKLSLLRLRKVRDDEVFNYKRKQIIEQIALDKNIRERLQKLYLAGAVEETKLLSNKSSIVKSQLALASLQSEQARSESTTNIEINTTLSQIKQLEDKQDFFTVTAPIDGIIQDFKYQTVGERLVAGDIIATIIPKVDLIARVNIPSTLSAPVELGKQASLDVDAYPSSDYGSINAELISLSPKTVSNQNQTNGQKLYIADLKLVSSTMPEKLGVKDLTPGLFVTARLKLRKKAIISLIFSAFDDLFTPLSQKDK